MNMNSSRIGVFVCRCGDKIEPLVDLESLGSQISGIPDVVTCRTLNYPCTRPGMEEIISEVAKNRLDRLVIAGCEGRLMLKKFETELEKMGLLKGQIDMVNVRGHVASVSDLPPQEKAQKAAKLIRASAAELSALIPTPQAISNLTGPVMIVGGGISAYMAAKELDQNGIDFMLSAPTHDPNEVIRRLHLAYPGERESHDRVKKLAVEVVQSPHGTLLPPGELTGLSGVTGDYALTFRDKETGESRTYRAGLIIACIDAELHPSGPSFGHDGETVLQQSDLEEYIWTRGAPRGRVLFWVSDYETGQEEFAKLSAKGAWNMARHIRSCSPQSHAMILYDQRMEIPLNAGERALNRALGIEWIPCDKAVRPTVQDRQITFCGTNDHLEHDIEWDLLVISPERALGGEGLRTAEVLGLVHKHDRFLTGHHARVRPEMVGKEESYLAGSGRYPCDLDEALAQGRRAALKSIDMLKKAENHELHVPRVVCVVDPDKCIGCGQCQELCDCGGIGVEIGPGGGLPRMVDPLVCTGGGTCAAACPYHALTLQNNSNDQREARIAALSSHLGPDEVVAFACAWGGLPAADIAGKMGMKYDPNVHILGIPCVGQLDPSVMARAFLEGAPGLLLVGCLPEECHHSFGVDHSWSRVSLIKKLLSLSGFDKRRIALAHADLNRPEAFIRTVESFSHAIKTLGPIERTPNNLSKLKTLYNMARDNSRVRHLLSAGLRRPWEDVYRGDQRHALEYDRDFTAVLVEEYMQQRLIDVMQNERRPLRINELATALHEDERRVASCLMGMVSDGMLHFSHKEREAYYALNN